VNRHHVPGCSPIPAERLFSGFPSPCIPLTGCPVLAFPVPAGFPSPAADFAEGRLSLDEHLIEHQEATFFVRVTGHSMTGFGIHDGDLLVVDRAIHPADKSVVIAVVDGEFAVKQLCRIPDGVLLRSHGAGHGDILVGPEQELTVWGVVRWSIHAICP
jgi:DNA polymerase V